MPVQRRVERAPLKSTDAIDYIDLMPSQPEACVHLSAIVAVKPAAARQCDDCVKTGSRWVHLRTCQTCGVTRCCDSSPNRHASTHARTSNHPVVASAEPGERWLYCFADDAFVGY
jgi:uncharacterized UBP type Zn finger protein